MPNPTKPARPLANILDRRNGDSQKWNKYSGRDILPMWVADIDCMAPPSVLTALHARIAHGCFGYAKPLPSLVETTQRYLATHYNWHVEADWLLWLPGLVSGLNLACRAINGEVMTVTPIYPPFLSAPGFSGQHIVRSALRLHHEAGQAPRWTWDWPAMEAVITPQTRLFLLCHPHNPVGRIWDQAELDALAAFCTRHDLIVCSDEIHCDLILDAPRRHRPFATLSAALNERTITLMAPSKTYNIAGLGCSFAVIANAKLRQAFTRAMSGVVPDVNVLALVAAEAAMRDGEEWRQGLLDDLSANRSLLENAISDMPLLHMTHVEATYLAWINARQLNLANPQAFFEEAGVGLSDGADFGHPGYVRLNFGCHKSTLEEALRRMRKALTTL